MARAMSHVRSDDPESSTCTSSHHAHDAMQSRMFNSSLYVRITTDIGSLPGDKPPGERTALCPVVGAEFSKTRACAAETGGAMGAARVGAAGVAVIKGPEVARIRTVRSTVVRSIDQLRT